MKDKLWSDALETSAPSISTESNTATGAKSPDREDVHSISCSVVS